MSRSECVNRLMASGMSWFEAQHTFQDQLAMLPGGERMVQVASLEHQQCREYYEPFDDDGQRDHDLVIGRAARGGRVRAIARF